MLTLPWSHLSFLSLSSWHAMLSVYSVLYRGSACLQAAKKARDFLIRKLKRRLVLLERAEQQKTEGDKDSNGLGKDASKKKRRDQSSRIFACSITLAYCWLPP